MPHEYLIIDAFSGDAFGGNPAAVVLGADDLSDERMRAIAAEFNLSETTFVLGAEAGERRLTCDEPEPGLESAVMLERAEQRVAALAGLGAAGGELRAQRSSVLETEQATGTSPEGAAARPSGDPVSRARTATRVRFRWFTPSVEVRMCGHATLAGVRALLEARRVRVEDPAASTVIEIETLSGLLRAYLERIPGRLDDDGHMIWLDLPRPVLSTISAGLDELLECLRIGRDDLEDGQPLRRTGDEDLLVFVRDVAILHGVAPDHRKLKEFMQAHSLRGVGVSTVRTLSPSIHAQSRFFAPASGIDEDPVTGSLHGPLAACLAERGLVAFHDGLGAVTCVQSKVGVRSGVVHALVQHGPDGRFEVRIGGQTVTVMRGWLNA